MSELDMERPYAVNYPGCDNYKHPWTVYVAKVAGMPDEQLEEQAEQMIWLSAFAANNPRSDFHTCVCICYDECTHRGKPEIYQRAYDAAAATM